MTDAAASRPSGRKLAEWRDLCVRIAAVLCVSIPAFFLVAAFGVKYQVFSWELGFQVLTMRVLPMLALAALAAAIAALALAFIVRPVRRWRVVSVCATLPLAALVIYGVLATNAANTPPIHDVSTDLINPPGFSPLVIAERAMARNGNVLDDLRNARVPDQVTSAAAGLKVSAVQQAAYADIQPIATGADPSRALAAARGVASKLGWVIDRVDDQAGVIEAREMGFWYGVVADIAIRVSPANPGAVVDIRSVSRVGLSDLGANAARVRAFQQALLAELSR
jgi:uncharacterized protein (DUF1499 family)